MLPSKESIPTIPFSEIPENAVLIDIRSEEAFETFQIPNAINLVVYEIAFAEKVGEAVKSKEQAIVVYGDDAVYRGADYAYTKLAAAGYTNAKVLEGGIKAWHEAQGTESPVEEKFIPASRSVSLEKSRVLWYGRNFFNQHNGKVPVQSGALEMTASGEILSGEIVIDMVGMICDDLTEEQGGKMLIGHLQSADFFLTDQYPTASFTFKSAVPIANACESSPNLEISGEMTIRGVTQPISFPAMVYPVANGFGLQAQFDFNRTLWDVIYGSGSFFERLGMHVVSDLISLHIQLIFDQ
jgi:rhodanese-related sulfurtransferase